MLLHCDHFQWFYSKRNKPVIISLETGWCTLNHIIQIQIKSMRFFANLNAQFINILCMYLVPGRPGLLNKSCTEDFFKSGKTWKKMTQTTLFFYLTLVFSVTKPQLKSQFNNSYKFLMYYTCDIAKTIKLMIFLFLVWLLATWRDISCTTLDSVW